MYVSFHGGHAPSYKHNRRDKAKIDSEKYTSVDLNRYHESLIDEDPVEVYRRLFFDALQKQNEKNLKNRHSDRVISFEDWIKKIKAEEKEYRSAASLVKKIRNKKERNKELKKLAHRPRLVYETIVQVGNIKEIPALNSPERALFDEQLKSIYTDFLKRFQEQNHNLYVCGAYLHFDEAGTPHMHLDYIPVAKGIDKKGKARGMEVQPSLSKAFDEMGYKTDGIYYTAQMKWQDAMRDLICEVARDHGIEATWEDRRRNGMKEIKQEHQYGLNYKFAKMHEEEKKLQALKRDKKNMLQSSKEEAGQIKKEALRFEEDTLNQAMIDAEKIKEDAEKEASTIKNKAQEEADKLIENAKSKAYYDEYRSQANNFLKTEAGQKYKMAFVKKYLNTDLERKIFIRDENNKLSGMTEAGEKLLTTLLSNVAVEDVDFVNKIGETLDSIIDGKKKENYKLPLEKIFEQNEYILVNLYGYNKDYTLVSRVYNYLLECGTIERSLDEMLEEVFPDFNENKEIESWINSTAVYAR